MESSKIACPVCLGKDTVEILNIPDIPVFCNIQLSTREEALSQPTGDMILEFCSNCSHVFNSAFDETLLAYSEAYENSLHYSATFSKFAEDLAKRLVQRYSLQGKKILEIGCGKGDFLALICELGANDGYGFDRSYVAGRAKVPSRGSVQYFQDFFSSEYSDLQPNFVACRHVLEHIPEPGVFIEEILSALGQQPSCTMYFEVPNVLSTIQDMGVWDLIYEHCQYFSPQSLTRVFVDKGVQVERVYDCFGRQFIALEGQVSQTRVGSGPESTIESQELTSEIANDFAANFRSIIDRWEKKLFELEDSALVWGAGSKGTTFLNLLDGSERIAGIIDINPNKQGKFVPCTGHEIMTPESLTVVRPKHVFIMNPMYRDEIESTIRALGVDAQTHVVD